MPSPPKSPSIGIRYISDAVKSDHRLIERLHASLVSPPPNTDSENQGALCSRLSWELARHLVAMELFIFPGTAHRAKQGSEAAQERQRDMAQLRDALRSFSKEAAAAKAVSGDGKLSAALEELGTHLGRHIRDVERVDLVNIENVLSGQESEDMARDFERSVFFIPHGVREEDEGEDAGVKAPYKSVEGLLDASAGELRAAMEKFPRE
ncbi:hypothetical protein INS49_015833 [Diaporthe citri]|uniref:uncharacterized protein n=1 Tax=Diaporthe citri TaxID=83186 RepID=UPI001C822CFF|nr:uncharacterized protein INS49_015833 [Diaporthe citri]KAG6356445.1 hypothetical protein INS49_015833 [Diaporthe citri]